MQEGRTNSPDAMQRELVGVVDSLRSGLWSIVEEASGPSRRPGALVESLDINMTLASRLLAALRADDVLESARSMPGPEALRSVVQAASRHGVDEGLLEEAGSRVEAFDRLIRDGFGGRSALDAFIADALPEAGEKFLVSNRQGMFKAASSIKGVQAEVSFATALVLPTEDPERCVSVHLGGYLGLRRLRPGMPVSLQVRAINSGDSPETGLFTLDGVPIQDAERGSMVERFCTQPLAAVECHHGQNLIRYELADDRVGLASSVDVVFAERIPAGFMRMQPVGERERVRRVWISNEAEIPSRTSLLDLLVPPDIWPGCMPELRVYDTVVRGSAVPNDGSRDRDLLPIEESVRPLGVGVHRFRVAEVPRYREMVEHVCEMTGCDPKTMRGYRVRIRYPFYGSQTMMLIDPPCRADGNGASSR